MALLLHTLQVTRDSLLRRRRLLSTLDAGRSTPPYSYEIGFCFESEGGGGGDAVVAGGGGAGGGAGE